MNKLFLTFLIVISNLILIRAQNYYPLQVGNVRYFGRFPEAILDSKIINGKEYFLTSDSIYQWIDEVGNVYFRKNDTTEFLWIKLNANIHDSWEFWTNIENTHIKCIGTLEGKSDTVITNDTVFYNCYRYTYHYIYLMDADYAIYLAPNVGIVKDSSIDWRMASSLTKALINNQRIPSKIILPEVIETSPANMQNLIPVDAQISVDFKFQIKPKYISQEYIKLFSKKQGEIPYHFNESKGGKYFNVRFTPNNGLINDDTITVFVSKKLADYMDDHLPEDYSFTFYTEPAYSNPNIFVKDTSTTIPKFIEGDFDFNDYDYDGDMDLIITGVVDTVDPYFVTAAQVFEKKSGTFIKKDNSFDEFRSVNSQSCIKWVDFNNDGFPDIVISGKDESFHPVTRFYENEDNRFSLRTDLNLDIGPAYMDWCDFDKDGLMDLAIPDRAVWPSSFCVSIYKNTGSSLIQYANLQLGKYMPGIHKWIDFNSDGWMDIIKTGNQLKDTKFFKNINGIFSEEAIGIESDYWLSSSYNIDYSDVDKDGDIDLIIGSNLLIRQDNKFIVDERGIETFGQAFAKFNDFDNDGFDDLFLIGIKADNLGMNKTYIQIYRNDKGRFDLYKEIRFNKLINLYSARWLDLNNDNKIDLAVMTHEGFQIYYNLMNIDKIDIPEMSTSDFSLLQNYPNPFNPTTTIKYEIPTEANVTIKIFDVLGREVAALLNAVQKAGAYEVEWNAKEFASGVYFYQVRAGDFIAIKKMILTK